MNALQPPPALPSADDLTPWPDAGRTLRLVRRLSGWYLAAVAVLLLVTFSPAPLAIEARASGLAGLAIGALLVSLTGLLAVLPMVSARWRFGPVQRLARLARRPQGIIVPLLGLGAASAAWLLRPGAPDPAAHATLLGAAAIVLTFPLLVAERIVAGASPARLPEAAELQALLFVPVAVIPLAGLLQIAVGLGLGWAHPAMALLAVYLCVVAAELAVRSLAHWFLPRPAPLAARPAVSSLAALLLQPGHVGSGGLAGPIRTHLGLDISRCWALRYMRAAGLPVGAFLALAAWGLTGVALIDLDQRGVYERFGVPVAVWPPGVHLGLPWRFGRVRRVEFGIVHALPLGDADAPAVRSGAEDAAPAAADRLWDGAHPAEVSFVIASLETAGGQSFQVVSVDLKTLYRVGLDDAAALHSAYSVAVPETLVRGEAGRLLARVFAGKVLAEVLGDNRERLAEELRAELQAELDRLDTGVELVGIAIEASHPPAAAEAYQNVQGGRDHRQHRVTQLSTAKIELDQHLNCLNERVQAGRKGGDGHQTGHPSLAPASTGHGKLFLRFLVAFGLRDGPGLVAGGAGFGGMHGCLQHFSEEPLGPES